MITLMTPKMNGLQRHFVADNVVYTTQQTLQSSWRKDVRNTGKNTAASRLERLSRSSRSLTSALGRVHPFQTRNTPYSSSMSGANHFMPSHWNE